MLAGRPKSLPFPHSSPCNALPPCPRSMFIAAAPVIATAMGASVALGVMRQRRRTSKPQARFTTRITDNSTAPFQHLPAPPGAAAAAAATACVSRQPSPLTTGSSSSDEAGASDEEGLAACSSTAAGTGGEEGLSAGSDVAGSDSCTGRRAPRGVTDAAAAFEQHHPYAETVRALGEQLPLNPSFARLLRAPGSTAAAVPQPPLPLEETPLVMVNTVKGLRALAAALERSERFGLDVEANALRSYLGLTSLLQISTGEGRVHGPCCTVSGVFLVWAAACLGRAPSLPFFPAAALCNNFITCLGPYHRALPPPPTLPPSLILPRSAPTLLRPGDVDYIVDALALHDHLGPLLRPAFADPAILKVLHGGASDVAWLQRDFHLYLVNVFDTERACVVRV